MSSVLVPIAPGFEELEAITITDLMVRAGVDVTTAGTVAGPVTAARGTRIVPDCTLEDVVGKDFDMIILPGGLPGADHLRDDATLGQILERHHASGRHLAAICAAPKVLEHHGFLDGRRVTSYPGALGTSGNDNVEICNDAIVQDGNIITSRGPGTAMDFALTLIGLLEGTAKRDEVEASLVR